MSRDIETIRTINMDVIDIVPRLKEIHFNFELVLPIEISTLLYKKIEAGNYIKFIEDGNYIKLAEQQKFFPMSYTYSSSNLDNELQNWSLECLNA